MWKFLYSLASPKYFYQWSGAWSAWTGRLAAVLLLSGTLLGLVFTPADYQQGDAFRIIYVHVPSAFVSLAIYSAMSFWAVLVLVWRIKIAGLMLKVSAPLGAWFTFLALFTGAVWGKPMWGTWWIWDARLTSELILLFIYLALIALDRALKDPQQASAAVAVMTLIGMVDIPIIHYSVNWWNTLHQGATLSAFAKPAIDTSMLVPLLLMITAFMMVFVSLSLSLARSELIWRDKKSRWVQKLFSKV